MIKKSAESVLYIYPPRNAFLLLHIFSGSMGWVIFL